MEKSFQPALVYRLFFLYLEPVSALVGAFYAAAQPQMYLKLLTPKVALLAARSEPDTQTLTTLYQLANLYLLFAINEHFVLSSTTSLRTWRTLLFGLLLADFGHLATMIPVAVQKGFMEVFIKCWMWNAMEWGSVGFVYVGAMMRISFFLSATVQSQRDSMLKNE